MLGHLRPHVPGEPDRESRIAERRLRRSADPRAPRQRRAESTSFIASLAYRLVLPDAPSSPALDNVPGDSFTTSPGGRRTVCRLHGGIHAAFALELLAD